MIDVAGALVFARKYALEALLIDAGGAPLLREYEAPFKAGTPHALYSGTKSFWGVAALYARDDGILELDEPVAATIDTWADDPLKRRVTLRMLLALTSGFGFGGLGSAVPTYERALAMPLKNAPGTIFTYGGIPLQVFGAVFARKLESRGETPHDYLKRRVLEPAGVTVSSWRTLADGTNPLPTGAFLTGENWLRYGRFVLNERTSLRECFAGSSLNPRYGLGWWLGVKGAPSDLFYASGSGGQALYIVPSLDATIVHFGKGASYNHATFLKRAFKR